MENYQFLIRGSLFFFSRENGLKVLNSFHCFNPKVVEWLLLDLEHKNLMVKYLIQTVKYLASLKPLLAGGGFCQSQ